MITSLLDFSSNKTNLIWVVIITGIMSSILFVQFDQVQDQMAFDLNERAVNAAQRVSNSVSPTIWAIYQKSKNRHISKDITSAILDSELSAAFLVGINVYGNFGHLFMGRMKLSDGQTVHYKSTKKNHLSYKDVEKIRLPIGQGAMTIGHVEVFYSNASYLPRLKRIYVVKTLQTIFITFFAYIFLYLLRKFSLAKISAENALQNLNITQDKLIESEKMASLGGLVSGVAHEINTPLGICITAASHLEHATENTENNFKKDKLTKEMLQELFDVVKQGNTIILSNLNRAATLVKNFKKVAVDQSIEEIRSINLGNYLDELLSSLGPKWKHTQVEVTTDFTDTISITSYPGPLAQIITNLIDNSLKHGFAEGTIKGTIHISIFEIQNGAQIIFDDNGIGMAEATLEKIFEPFFTTKRGAGGTGLGMHIVYNLVTQKLSGHINCHSTPSQGTQFQINLPPIIEK